MNSVFCYHNDFLGQKIDFHKKLFVFRLWWNEFNPKEIKFLSYYRFLYINSIILIFENNSRLYKIFDPYFMDTRIVKIMISQKYRQLGISVFSTKSRFAIGFQSIHPLITINFYMNFKLKMIINYYFVNRHLETIIVLHTIKLFKIFNFFECYRLQIIKFEVKLIINTVKKEIFRKCSELATISISSCITIFLLMWFQRYTKFAIIVSWQNQH
jgi:hypothetical protein